MLPFESLRRSERPDAPHEVIVVVNSAAGADASIIEQNEKTLSEARAWLERQAEPKLTVHLVEARELPPRELQLAFRIK